MVFARQSISAKIIRDFEELGKRIKNTADLHVARVAVVRIKNLSQSDPTCRDRVEMSQPLKDL